MACGYRKSPRLRATLLVVFLTLLTVGLGSQGALGFEAKMGGGWQPGPDEYHPSRLIVEFDTGIRIQAAADSVHKLGYSLESVQSFVPTEKFPGGLSVGIVDIPESETVDRAIARLSGAPGIIRAERDYKKYKCSEPVFPNDIYFPQMWPLHNHDLPENYRDPEMPWYYDPVNDADIDAPEAWAMFKGSSEVIVAVIDTGTYIDHPDLADHIWVNEAELYGEPGVDDDGNGYIDDIHGWDFYNNDNSVFDRDERDKWGDLNDEHGTHCSGTIGAMTNNGIGVSGINWNVTIMPIKFLGPDGGYTSDSIKAIRYAAANGATIASCSWGGGGYEQIVKDVIEASGMLFLCAAGNEGVNTDLEPHYPSGYDLPNIISVGASMQNDEPCYYSGWWGSNYGAKTVDLFAPGGFILSTLPPDPVPDEPAEKYAFFYGTSMATPHVSGVAALVASQNPDMLLYPGAPGWKPGDRTVRDIILGSVDVKSAFKGKCVTGGRLNAANALRAASGPVIVSATAQPAYGQPPLDVVFSASATTPVGVIVDQWWDFGDGSAVVHEFEAQHRYSTVGDYNASFHVVNDLGIESVATVEINVCIPPVIEINPTSVESNLAWGETQTRQVTITNTGEGELNYSVGVELFGSSQEGSATEPRGWGGPDDFGYIWIDSDHPAGPEFDWIDISRIGTALPLQDDGGQTVPLPFEFPFYGKAKTKIGIASNGYLSFGTWLSTWRTTPIPDSTQPNDLLAVCWIDLDPQRSGMVYYWGDDSKFIVEWQDVPGTLAGGPYTFQAILTPDGAIKYQYKSMLGTHTNECTIGIENSSGTVGLQVARDELYVHDELAILFSPTWINVSPVEGTVAPGSSAMLDVRFDAGQLPRGSFPAAIRVKSNDPIAPEIVVDTCLNVNPIMPPVITSIEADPRGGAAPLEVNFTASAYDLYGEVVRIVWDFGDGSDPVEGTLTATHTYTAEGEYDAVLTVVDDDGLTATATLRIAVRALPKAEVNPPEIRQAIRAHRTRTERITVANTGDADLVIEACAAACGSPGEEPEQFIKEGSSGQDKFGYIWRDSNMPGGPKFEWAEISEIGTKLTTLKSNQYEEIELPWEFSFYGQPKTSVKVNAAGFLTFGPTLGSPTSNTPLPDIGFPNELLAVWWDTLRPASAPQDGGVFHYYDAENDRVIVEYKDVPRSWNSGQLTFEVMLYPDGRIVYQYLDMSFGNDADEASATIGIENADGTDGLEVLCDAYGYIENNLAIEFRTYQWLSVSPGSATIEPGQSQVFDVVMDLASVPPVDLDGYVVFDTNDVRAPRTIVPVHVSVIENIPPVISACAVNPSQAPAGTVFQFVAAADDLDGTIVDKYWTFGDGAPVVHEFTAEHEYVEEGTYVATFTAVDNDGYKTSVSIRVRVQDAPCASWTPGQFRFTAAQRQTVSDILILHNTGEGELVFGSAPASILPQAEDVMLPESTEDEYAMDTRGSIEPERDNARSPWLPENIGRVIKSWTCPWPMTATYGVAVNYNTGELFLSDSLLKNDLIVTPDGKWTERGWAVKFPTTFPADMAFDGQWLWQVGVGSGNPIYKMDPATGEVQGSISNRVWSAKAQRSLAYNPNDDTFYIGGWNDRIIYHVKGETWDVPGEVLDKWPMPVPISGLAYHPVANILAVTTNANPDMVYFVDCESHATVAQFPHPYAYYADYTGAGCSFDADGNLWLVSQANNSMYLVETGLGPIAADWLSWAPENGRVEPAGSAAVTVTVDTTELVPGTVKGSVILYTNDAEYPMIMVPVVATVKAAPRITECTVTPVIGEPPLEVTFHAKYEVPETPVASYGWDFGDGTTYEGLDAVHTYAAEGTYEAVFRVVDAIGGVDEARTTIEVKWLPCATVSPQEINITLAPNEMASQTVTLGNVEGNAPLNYSIKVQRKSAPFVAMPEVLQSVADPYARTAADLSVPFDQSIVAQIAENVKPQGAGNLVTSWTIPSVAEGPWGIGVEDHHVWISDTRLIADHKMTKDGEYTGVSFETPWIGFGGWPADMAFDTVRNIMWQVNTAGDLGIYGIDPATGEVVDRIISNELWAKMSQRGLAYNPDDDTFYIGGWNQKIIFHIKGPSWDQPGAILEQWSFPVNIAGLAYHPAGVLWVTDNGQPDMIYGIDVETHKVIEQFLHPAYLYNSGAGAEVDSEGNLWVISMDEKMVYVVSTGLPPMPPIGVDPGSGSIPAGETCEITVEFDALKLGRPGDDVERYLEIVTDDPMVQSLNVKLNIHIEGGPVISKVTATPAIGQPPLAVVFDGLVEPGDVPITDVWWDFGDGSESVHDAHAEHTYTSVGQYEAELHAVDENGVSASEKVTVTVKWLPVFNVEPMSFDEVVLAGTEAQSLLTISNTGVSAMDFAVTTMPSFAQSPEWKRYAEMEPVKGESASRPIGFAGAGAGGPDQFGYVWMDSNQENGPVFDWFEIREVGRRIELFDEDGVTVPLPFKFPFYGSLKTQVGIASNGYLSFDQSQLKGHFRNSPIPNSADPNDLMAVYWTDLDPEAFGDVYYYHDELNGRFIVEYDNVPEWGDEIGSTYQVILYPNGTIVYQYLSINGDPEAVTVGIEDAIGADGLQVVYNAAYLEDGLAVAFSPAGSVVRVNPDSGHLVPGGKQDVVVTLGSPDAAPGTYSLYLYVTSDDPFRPCATIPVTVKLNQAPTVTIVSPAASDKWEGTKEIVWKAADPDDPADSLSVDIAWTRDGETWNEIASALPNSGSYEWDTKEVGKSGDSFRVRIVVSDPAGESAEAVSGEFAIEVLNVAPEVKILKPEAGAVWTGTRAIEYEAVDADGDTLAILLEYDCLDDEAGWQLIADGEENTGKYLWDISKLAKGGLYKVRVTATDPDGAEGHDVSDEFTVIVLAHAVVAAPNPARQSVTFYYDAETDGKLYVYDVAGRLVYSAELTAGSTFHMWDLTLGGRPVASGLYLYVVVTDGGETSEVGRLVIQR